MHINSLDVFHDNTSFWHRLDARVKLLFTLAYVLTLSLLPVGTWPVYVLLFAVVVSVAVAAELSVPWLLRRALLALPFALAALPLLVTTPGKIILAVPLSHGSLTFTSAGLMRFLSIACKSWLSMQAALLLTATTSLPDLLLAMRALHLPGLLVSIVGMMWRYLFVLADEAMRMLRAREARSAAGQARGGGSIVWRARIVGGMVGSMFVRGYERSERIYNAMLSRGYDGTVRALPPKPLPAMQRGFLTLTLLMFLGLLWVGLWMA